MNDARSRRSLLKGSVLSGVLARRPSFQLSSVRRTRARNIAAVGVVGLSDGPGAQRGGRGAFAGGEERGGGTRARRGPRLGWGRSARPPAKGDAARGATTPVKAPRASRGGGQAARDG